MDLPRNQVLIDCKWICKLKNNSTSDQRKIYIIKLVARKFTQEKGVDYNKIFSHVIKYITIRLICAFCNIYLVFVSHVCKYIISLYISRVVILHDKLVEFE